MGDDERVIYESMVCEYQQALADVQLSLAKVNGQLKVKDRTIDALRSQLVEQPTGPKPGPHTA